MDKSRIHEGISWLAAGGLNLFSVLDVGELETAVTSILASSHIPYTNYTRLILIGHGGRHMWTQLQQTDMSITDPVDTYSINLTQQFIDTYLEGMDSLILYPTDYLVPLGQLGEQAGWSHPSPLGQGINPQYGVWFAYRTAFLTVANLPVTTYPPTESPCLSCADKPCLTACPAGATGETFALTPCVQHRLHPQSTCTDRCLARMACPIAPEHQYTLPQIQYHYGESLKTLKKYYNT
ncbi:MAG: hypothetical protein CSB13_06940 [Chloroflexi bacterium]|nr:MAG: hypothetical protein CSB13_06940 [Chloroflexota bacterium]